LIEELTVTTFTTSGFAIINNFGQLNVDML